jgi:maleate cis-trans isomerase
MAAKIALMVPANNTTVAAEMPVWLEDGFEFETVRIPRPKGLLTLEVMPAYKASALDLAATLKGKNFDLIAYACTAASFLQGPEADIELAKELNRVSGIPAATTGQAMVQCLKSIGAKHIALVSPYSSEVNRRLVSYLGSSSISVARLGEMPAADTDALGRITSGEVAAMMRKTFTAECDAAFIACAQLPSIDIVDTLAAEFGKPVWSSVKATAWAVANALGRKLRTK